MQAPRFSLGSCRSRMKGESARTTGAELPRLVESGPASQRGHSLWSITPGDVTWALAHPQDLSGVISSVPTVMGSQSSISCCNPLSDTVPTYSQDPFSGGRQKVPQPPRVQTSYTGKGLLRAFGCSSNSTCQTDDRANVQISGDYVRNCI